MATEKVDIDILFKTADAASSVKELRTALRDLRSAALAVDEGSPAFDRITQKAGELNDSITRVNENIKANTGSVTENVTRSFGNLASTGVRAFGAVQGAAALLGVESKDLQQTLVTLNAAMAVSDGLKAFAELPDVLRDARAVFATLTVATEANAIATTAASVAEGELAVATGAATVSMNGLKIAIAATGIGALVIGLGFAITYFDDLAKAANTSAASILATQNALIGLTTSFSIIGDAVDQYTQKEQKAFDTAKQNLELAKLRGDDSKTLFKLENDLIDASVTLATAKKAAFQADINDTRTRINGLENELKANGKLTEDKQKSLDNLRSIYNSELKTINDLTRTIDNAGFDRLKVSTIYAKIFKEEADKLAKELLEKERDTTTKLGDEILKRQQAIDKAERDGLELSRLRNDEEFKIEEQRILNLKALEDQRKRDILSSENEVDTAKTIAFENFKKIEEAKFSIAESTAAGLGAIGNIITKEGKKQEAVNKGLALVQIAIDTARAIGSLTANSEANPANAVTFGAAGIAQFAAGIVRILANIAAAKKILTTPSTSANISPIGGSAPTGAQNIPTAPATPSATALFGTGGAGNVGGGGNAGQGGAIKVFVVESDITNAQRSVDESRGEIRIG